MKLLTNDLYEGAWLLSKGMTLANLWTEPNGRRSVVFEFAGESIEGLKEEYKRGKASANVYQLKAAMSELRDRMYALLRDRVPQGGHGSNELPSPRDQHSGGYRLRKGGNDARTYQEAVRD